jgi:CheY-like chemotaxis protein
MAAAKQIETPGSSTKPAVLVVEDVVLVRLLVADFLRGRGFHVIEVANADEAVRVLESDFPVDVVLSDIHMPGGSMDGLGLARWVRAHRPDLKVILASGIVSEVDPAEAAYYEGAILRKPFNNAELERRLRSAIEDLEPGG